ncbi:aminoacyl-tRNA hydrolase [Litoribacter ruber]|uniref:alternative ribosome rescue aminoacyl-tRNA hydrolase ArfB n=1 Tax=Litoribacter ruber TaxID=702568 RepID=UPI001BDAFB57|nr:alternative ribosome rescue aminoacyl-tRNA hydrolase ArfB [Litoribacter ruber]MBT0810852.1 aminoacyl-tRNA hydrolase [Litoribacter ruber]
MPTPIQYRGLESELTFQTSRSSGPGGQNVNKVESRVTLRFNVPNSIILAEEEKQRLSEKLDLTTEGDLIIKSQETRSQLKNKEIAIQKFYETLKGGLAKKKVRKVTRPSKAAVKKRLEAKKQHSQKKQNRGKVDF